MSKILLPRFNPLIIIKRPQRIFHFGKLHFTWGDIEAGRFVFSTEWRGELRAPDGTLKQRFAWGPGVLTQDFVNQIVSQAVTGTSVVPYLSSVKYMAYGTAASPTYTDGDTNVTTEGTQARTLLTLTNNQTANGTNHQAILQYATGTVTITVAATYTEFAIVDTASGATAHCLDHQALSPVATAAVNDTLSVTYDLKLNSNV